MSIISVVSQDNLVGFTVTRVAASSGGDQFLNISGGVYLDILNTGTQKTLTVISSRDSNFGVFVNHTETIPAGVSYVTRAFEPRRFNTDSGYVLFSFNDVTGVSVAAIKRTTIYRKTS